MSRSRFIEEEVSNCGSCPFHYVQDIDINMDTGNSIGVAVAGYYCMHRKNRYDVLLAFKDLEESGFTTANNYFRHMDTQGEPFPERCPLKPKDLGPKIMKLQRRIDLT